MRTFPACGGTATGSRRPNAGTFVVYGRSDSTLNRSGVRLGTSEFYRVVEEMDEVQDSLVIDTGLPNEQGQLLLFLRLSEGVELNDDLQSRVRARLRRAVVSETLTVTGYTPYQRCQRR